MNSPTFSAFFSCRGAIYYKFNGRCRNLQRPVNNLFSLFLVDEAVLKCDSQQLHVGIELLVVEHVAHLLCILSDSFVNQSVALEPSC